MSEADEPPLPPPSLFADRDRAANTVSLHPASARSIKSAERTLALFELFSLEQRGLTVGAVSRALGMPQPSVTMLLKNLLALGYLEYDRTTRTYIPTLRIAVLGAWMHRRFSEDLQLEQSLIGIQRRVGESSFIAIQNGASSQYVIGINSSAPQRLEVQSGQFRPITITAAGRALLSLKSDVEVMALAQRCNAELRDEQYRVNTREFLELIRKVRRQGFAETSGDSKRGHGAIAITARTPISNMPIAIGVGGPLSRLWKKRDQILAELGDLQARLRSGLQAEARAS